jgi:hypothetical protein
VKSTLFPKFSPTFAASFVERASGGFGGGAGGQGAHFFALQGQKQGDEMETTTQQKR